MQVLFVAQHTSGTINTFDATWRDVDVRAVVRANYGDALFGIFDSCARILCDAGICEEEEEEEDEDACAFAPLREYATTPTDGNSANECGVRKL